MTQLREVYFCEVCGNLVECVGQGNGKLVCCGQPMTLQKENTKDAAVEKHVPVATRQGNNVHVQVGEKEHPMEQSHYIEWIELLQDNKIQRVELQPGEKPVADFIVDENLPFTLRAWCNLHGLWK